MHDETTGILSLGVELVLLGAVVITIAGLVVARNRLSDAVNRRSNTDISTANYRQFNKYDMGEHSSDCKNHIYGDELMELIRNYYDTDITIYVDKLSSSGSSLTCNRAEWLRDKDKFSYKELQKVISPNTEYHTYLVYDDNNASEVDYYTPPRAGSVVTGVAVYFVAEH